MELKMYSTDDNINALLFVDTYTVKEHEKFIGYANDTTSVIFYNSGSASSENETRESSQINTPKTRNEFEEKLNELILGENNVYSDFVEIERIGFVFSTAADIKTTKLIENSSYNDSANIEWLASIINKLHVRNVDFFGCNTLLNQEWLDFYGSLTDSAAVSVYANPGLTGNPSYGGNWKLEKYDGASQEGTQSVAADKLYFNSSISEYPYLFDSFVQSTFVLDKNGYFWCCGNNAKYCLGGGGIDNLIGSTVQTLTINNNAPKIYQTSSIIVY
jgi:hypothetical protein